MKTKVGIIGLGYWGPNYIRNFTRFEQSEVIWCCDLSKESLKKSHKLYPQVKLTKNYNDLLNDPAVDLIAIATPPITHYEIAKAALNMNKHVLVAKPLANKSLQVYELIEIAKKKNLLLHCDVTYLYSGAIRGIKDLLNKGSLGKPLYYDSTRTNLGLIQNDINVIWDLAPHDLSIIKYFFNLKPIKISAMGSKHIGESNHEQMAHITISFENNFIAHIHISWLSPVKLRTVLIGGTKRMVLYDDIQPDEKVRIYDKNVLVSPDSITPFKPVYRSGNILIPKIDNEEALYLETIEIINQIRKKKITYDNAQLNMEITTLLEACDKSLKSNKPVYLN